MIVGVCCPSQCTGTYRPCACANTSDTIRRHTWLSFRAAPSKGSNSNECGGCGTERQQSVARHRRSRQEKRTSFVWAVPCHRTVPRSGTRCAPPECAVTEGDKGVQQHFHSMQTAAKFLTVRTQLQKERVDCSRCVGL